MKNEQEIVRSVFDAYIRDAKATSTKKDRPTFDMLEEVKNRAIKSLEQQPSDDCVSRAEVFEIMGNLMSIPYDFDRPINEDDVSESMDRIKALPPVTTTQRWIPVSGRLPTKEEYIANNGLFIVSDGNRTYAEYFDVYNSMKYFGEPTMNGFRVDRCVIAWQSLPQPYEEKRGNEKW